MPPTFQFDSELNTVCVNEDKRVEASNIDVVWDKAGDALTYRPAKIYGKKNVYAMSPKELPLVVLNEIRTLRKRLEAAEKTIAALTKADEGKGKGNGKGETTKK